MNINVTGRHIEITENLRQYVIEKISKFEKYLGSIFDAAITLDVEKYRHKADVLLKANSVAIQAESVTSEMYASIDDVVDKLERQLKKQKGKFTAQRKRGTKASVETVEVEKTPMIVTEKLYDKKPMSPEEAAMELEMLGNTFMVFTNASTNDINVIYKRTDGNYGLITPVR